MVDWNQLSSILIHLLMIIAVTVYTLLGAYIMQSIENKEINNENLKNGYTTPDIKNLNKRALDDNHYYMSENNLGKVVLNGRELSLLAPELHDCVEKAVSKLMGVTKCNDDDIDSYIITEIDDCYRYAKIDLKSLDKSKSKYTKTLPTFKPPEEDKDEWNFANAVVFAFTVITTIGYGNVAPVTFEGRLFCIIYGLIGVPLTLLTIADIGMFLSKVVKRLVNYEQNVCGSLCKAMRSHFSHSEKNQEVNNNTPKNTPMSPLSVRDQNGNVTEKLNGPEDPNPESPEEHESSVTMPEKTASEAITLGVIFLTYLIVGAIIISLYEPDMDVFKAFYFNFVTLTTIGLGDITPRRYKFLVVTFLYITIGLSLTTMVIEIAAEYLRKLHYFGRAIENVGQVEVWLGGKKMKLNNFLKHLGDQLNIPEDELKQFDMDNFVNDAIKVTEGEIKTLRKQPTPNVSPPIIVKKRESGPLSYRDLRKSFDPSTIQFVDEGTISERSQLPPKFQPDSARTVSSSGNF